MVKAKIMIVENDGYCLKVRKEFLEGFDYEVVSATSLRDARATLRGSDIDLAIIDMRLQNDSDENDITGLLLAEDEDFLSVPKIIMTGFPQWEQTRRAMTATLSYIDKKEGLDVMLKAVTDALTTMKSNRSCKTKSNKVFLVHGHDKAMTEEVKGIIYKLDLEPIVLNEIPRQNRTIIELIETHSGVEFAIAILTPDDIGSSKREPRTFRDRPRQNVVFELGFFIGKLGRSRVCALCAEGIEIPSDYSGVFYIPLDQHQGWKMRLFKELKEVGFDVDANKII